MKKPPDALTAPTTVTHCRFFDLFFILRAGVRLWLLHLRSGAGNLKLAKVLRFRACQHGGTYEVRPAFDAVLPCRRQLLSA